jgi:hypothetical protein
MALNIRLSPRGKLPVLFSLRLNSMVLMAASMALALKPVVAMDSNCEMMSDSTYRNQERGEIVRKY